MTPPADATESWKVERGDADALFFSTLTLLVVLIGVVVYAKTSEARRMLACLLPSLSMVPPDDKALNRKISTMQPAVTLSRDTAAILISVVVMVAYSYINYLHTGYRGDLIAALAPFAVLGLLTTFHWPVSGFKNSPAGAILCSISGALFTITILYELSCQRGHFDHRNKHVISVILLCVAALVFLGANFLEGFRAARAVKEASGASPMRTGLFGRVVQTVRRRMQDTAVRDSMKSLEIDTRTYMVIGLVDIVIVGLCSLAFAIVYAIHLTSGVKNWQLAYIPLIAAPFVYWCYQLVYLASALSAGRGGYGRLAFNLVITTLCTGTLLLFMLSAFGVFSHEHYTWLVGVPLYTVVSLFVISVAVSSPMVVPALTIDCLGEGDQCAEVTVNAVSGGMTAAVGGRRMATLA